jgi:hypothetical protein
MALEQVFLWSGTGKTPLGRGSRLECGSQWFRAYAVGPMPGANVDGIGRSCYKQRFVFVENGQWLSTSALFAEEFPVGGISERGKEIKRRRHRRKKLQHLEGRLKKATASEKAVIAAKLRQLTPGAEVVIDRWQLRENDR